jgi:Cyclophilin-like
MTRIRFEFGTLALDAELLDTPTAKAVLAALPLSSVVLTWGEEIYFDVPITVPRETGASGDHAGRNRLLAGRSGTRDRLWAHANLPVGGDAAREPVQRVRARAQ